MAVFTYRALNDQAAVVEGTIAADTARAARDALRLRGLIVESVAASGSGAAYSAEGAGVSGERHADRNRITQPPPLGP